MAVAVITGSQACLPPETADKHHITILPYTLELDGRLYRDGIDISAGEFYRLLPSLEGTPHTQAISPGVFLEAFGELSSSAGGILVVTIAGTMSGTFNNAQLAARLQGDIPVKVLDSGTAAMAQGFAVLTAAEAAGEGASLEECYQAGRDAADRAELFAYIDTFEYLKKSGRVDALRAFAATTLSIKPVFRMKDGRATFVARRRSARKARSTIAGHVAEYCRKRGPLRLSIFHAAAEEEARELAGLIEGRVEVQGEVITTEFTPVMGCHTGPGVVGAAFL